MSQKYIKQDCPKCPNVHSMMLMANGICKCQSCLKKYKVNTRLKEICHVCKKEKKPYIVILTNDILSLISHEQAREEGPICERCDCYFAMTGDFKDATEEEFNVAREAVQFAANMLKWWEKDNKLYSGEMNDYLPEDPAENKRSWGGTVDIAKWYRQSKLGKIRKLEETESQSS